MPSNHLIFCCPFSSCLQSFPASESFPMSWLFASGGQGIGASASVLPMNAQDWFPLGLTRIAFRISLQSKGLSRVFCNTTVQKHQFFSTQPFLWSNSHIYWKDRLLISWLQSPSTVILEPKKIKSVTVSTFPPFYLSWSSETRHHDLSFWMLSFKLAWIFTLLFHSHQEAL